MAAILLCVVLVLSAAVLRLKRRLSRQNELLGRSRDAVKQLADSVVEILNEAAISGSNELLLSKKLMKIRLLNDMSETGLVRNFSVLANICLNNLADRLMEISPSLTRAELEYCCMLAMQMQPVAICKILEYKHYATFYNKSAAIRKKLRVPKALMLEDYLKQVADKNMF